MGKYKKGLWLGVLAYSILVGIMCFIPQPVLVTGVETPGIQHFGRVVVLLVPFNSLVNLGQVDSLRELVWVFLQNGMNIFLIFPLIFQLLYLVPTLRQTKRVILISFAISLGIETTQVILDLLINANRVFEIDDLWTNTLGGYLAWKLYQFLSSFKLPSLSKEELN